MTQPTANDIDKLLPQTQCGDCGFKGCLPYAVALAKAEAEINLCLPGGQTVLKELAQLLDKNAADYVIEEKPLRIAKIREDECIGCTKCIQACPVDAISGAAKLMHTVISDECTGCNLCVEPCPMDCIDMLDFKSSLDENEQKAKASHNRQRFIFRQARLERDHLEQQEQHQEAKLMDGNIKNSIEAKKIAVQAAVARVKAKRLSSEPRNKN